MRRRGLTVLVGAVALVLLFVGIGRAQVPYVMFEPGPTYDTLGKGDDGEKIITVKGAPASTSAGQLRLTTIGVRSKLTVWDAMWGWWDDERAVLPRDIVYPPDKSQRDIEQENEEYFRQSQTDAETAALSELGYRIEITVTEVSKDFPAVGVLEVGDVIVSIDGTPVDGASTLTELVRARPAGTVRQVVVKRAGGDRTVAVATKEQEGVPRLGVRVEQKQPHPFELTIQLNRVGGPSAGLMFALGIIDTLRPEDLTGGKIIAGTGAIDADGNVIPIGGIPQKLVAAKAAKAKVFLTPEANCEEALANAQDGLPLAKVATLDDALAALEAVRAGRTPAPCTAR